LAPKKMVGLMLAAGIMFTSAVLVYANDGIGQKDSMHENGEWQHRHEHMMAKILNLTDDQQKQLKDSWKKQKDATKAIFEQMRTNKQVLEAELIKSTPDMNKINDIQTQIKALVSQMVDDHLNGILEVKKILTPEQFAGYMALKKERMMMHHKMGHDKFEHKGGFDNDGDQDHGSDD